MADQERKNHNNDSRSNRQISIAKVCRQVIEHLGECLEDYEQLFGKFYKQIASFIYKF